MKMATASYSYDQFLRRTDRATASGGSFKAGLFTNPSKVAATPPTLPRRPGRSPTSSAPTTNAYVGDVSVTESGGTLTVSLGPQGLFAPLKHFDGDTFSWLPPGATPTCCRQSPSAGRPAVPPRP